MPHSRFNLLTSGICLAVVLILSSTTPSIAHPPEGLQPISLKDNAALWYWQAFNQMNGVDIDHLYQDWPPNINTEGVQAWLDTEIMDYLHRGVTQPACAWGTDFQRDGINALLPHLGPARNLAKLAGVRAEYYFQQGDIDLAVDDLIAAMTLGRHLPNPGVLIDVLVQISISQLSQQVLVHNLHRLDHEHLLRLQNKLAGLPPRKTVSQSITTEEYLPNWIVNRVRQDGADSLRGMVVEGLLEQEDLDEIIRQTGGTVEGFEKSAEQIRGYYDQLEHIMTLGYDEVDHAEDLLIDQVRADGNALALLLLPACSAARRTELRHEARKQMLHAMITYQIDGPKAFARITDPYDGQPFDIQAIDSAVVLRSRMPDKDGNLISVTFPGIKIHAPDDQP